jgi:hypothetical protein
MFQVSNTSVAIHIGRGEPAAQQFSAYESGNHTGEDRPINDDTTIYVTVAEDVSIFTTIGQWRKLVDAVERDIAVIPVERERQRERQAHWAELRAAKQAAS